MRQPMHVRAKVGLDLIQDAIVEVLPIAPHTMQRGEIAANLELPDSPDSHQSWLRIILSRMAEQGLIGTIGGGHYYRAAQ